MYYSNFPNPPGRTAGKSSVKNAVVLVPVVDPTYNFPMQKNIPLLALLLLSTASLRAQEQDEEEGAAPQATPRHEAAAAARNKGYRAEEASSETSGDEQPLMPTPSPMPSPLPGSTPRLNTVGQSPASFNARPGSGSGSGGGKGGDVGGAVSLEGYPIPNPSKEGSKYGAPHAGANGAGEKMNAWAIDPVVCDNASPPIKRLWRHNIDFDAYAPTSGNDHFQMEPDEALSYRFVPNAPGGGGFTAGETTEGYYAPLFMSLSTKPCDFDVAKAGATPHNFCYLLSGGQSSLHFEVTKGASKEWGVCKVTPGQTYYFNVRHHSGGKKGTDSCRDADQKHCGGLVQVSFSALTKR